MKFSLLLCAATALFFAPALPLRGAALGLSPQDPASVLQAYLRATFARDFAEAYRYISTADRRIRDLDRYVRQRGALNGFALEAAKKLAETTEIKSVLKPITPDRVEALVRYKVPHPDKSAALLLNWNAYQLNSLPPAERKQLLDSLEKKQRDGSLEMIEGEEKFALVKDADGWRIFLHWAAGIKIPLRILVSPSADVDVGLSKNQVVVQPGDLFEISLRIKNRSNQPVIARIGHLVEPRSVADFLDFVQCGFLLPVRLEPAKEQEFSGTYLIRGNIPEGVRQLTLTYDFRLNP
jgi:hypothetical protein